MSQPAKDPHHDHHDHELGGDCVTCEPGLAEVQRKRRKRSRREQSPQRKPMRYVSLHHHSTFSFLDGFQMPDAHVRRAAEIGMQSLALTEHGNVSSHVKLEKASQEHGVNPIYGVELYCGHVDEDRKSQRKNHLTVLAEDQAGYSNMMRLVTQSWKDTYYEPTTSGATLTKYKKGLIILSGCTGSLLATSLVGGKNIPEAEASFERGLRVAQRFQKSFGDNYYLEVQAFPELDNVKKINKMIYDIHKQTGIPLVATGDCHYTDPTENEVQQILHSIRAGTRQTLEQQAQAWGYDVPLAPPITDKEIYQRLKATGLPADAARDAILNTGVIADRCKGVVLPKADPLRFPIPEGYDRESYWRYLLKKGWNYRGINRLSKAEKAKYKARLDRELEVIEGKDFQDYFMIVSDLVIYSKETGIPVGPARGSAAASLVCWLLRITEVDPVFFDNLVFERFIDHSRADLPDIDLDFDSERRHEIKEYAERKYGAKNVGLIATFTFFKSKNSLDDVARVYRIPQFEVDKIKDVLIERSSGDLRPSNTIEDTVAQFEDAGDVLKRFPDLKHSMDLEGNIKGLGAHAGGLIIASQPIDDVAAVYRKKVKDVNNDVVGWDKEDVERQGLIKIDTLGLSTMTMLAEALRLLDMKLEDLYDIPLDDERVVAGFHEADVVGIFQFDGRATRNVTRELKPDTFMEVADICALSRPGPLHNGATSAYIALKHGVRAPEPVHPILDDITKDTHFQIVYQEQILRIVREIGNFDWTAAAYIRKIISKKLGEQEFERQFGRFLDGALSHEGMTEEIARDVWNRCITAGSYAFNAAHSVSYGMLAWWCMWLKVYHPEVFYVASLAKLPKDKNLDLLKDAQRHGITALRPNPKKSGVSWSVASKGRIRGGLSQVSGIGEKTAAQMIEHREQSPVTNWTDYTAVRGIGPKTIDKVYEFVEQDDPYKIQWLRNRVDKVKDAAVQLGLPEITHSSEDVPYSADGINHQVTWAGVIISRNLRDIFELHYSRTGEELDPATVKDPHLREYVTMNGDDDTDIMTVAFSRWNYPKYRRSIWGVDLDRDVVVVQGVKLGNQARRAIYAERFWVVNPDVI